MKPLAYEYPANSTTYDIWNEYLFGNSFLVAPTGDGNYDCCMNYICLTYIIRQTIFVSDQVL
jgi:hypothetical protein